MDHIVANQGARAHQQSQVWHLLPWFFFLMVTATLLWPLAHLWPAFRASVLRETAHETGGDALAEMGESAHFRVEAPPGYMTREEVAAFLATAERQREALATFLGIGGNGGVVTVRLHPGGGTPHTCGPAEMDLYAVKSGNVNLIHELSHCMLGGGQPLLVEGLAVAMEERFGWGVASVTRGHPINAYLYQGLRQGKMCEPLEAMWNRERLQETADSSTTCLRYLQAGSFVNHLLTTYGRDRFFLLFRYSDFRLAYGHDLDALGEAWHRTLHIGHLIQACAMVLGGLAVLTLVYAGYRYSAAWCAAAAMGLIAYYVWSYYLVYSLLVPSVLTVIVIASGVFLSSRPGLGLRHVLLLGAVTLVPLLVLPAGIAALR